MHRTLHHHLCIFIEGGIVYLMGTNHFPFQETSDLQMFHNLSAYMHCMKKFAAILFSSLQFLQLIIELLSTSPPQKIIKYNELLARDMMKM